jgi:hypothetical protein
MRLTDRSCELCSTFTTNSVDSLMNCCTSERSNRDALPENRSSMELHLQRFLQHTALRGMAWANLAHHDIQFTTLLNTADVG